MSRAMLSSAMLLATVLIGGHRSFVAAQTGPYDLPPGYRQREVHDPSSSRYMWRRDRGNQNEPDQGGGGGVTPLPVPVPPWNGPGWGNPGWGWGNPGWGWRNPGWGWGNPWAYPAYPPPVWVPAEDIYGPGAVYRMLNSTGAANRLNGVAADAATRNIIRERPAPGIVQANPPQQKQKKISDSARARAAKYGAVGDEAFQAQTYALALARYRRAADSEPDKAQWRFRIGQTLVALGRYEDAADQFRQALAIDPAAPQGPMRLDVLYGPNQIAKADHIEALAQAATRDPHHGDLMFLLGIELYMDGQRARSRKFFERADQLALGANAHLRPFLNVIPVEQPLEENDPLAEEREL